MGAVDPILTEPRQRWRIAFARTAGVAMGVDEVRGGEPLTLALERTGLPIARSGARPKIAFAASLSAEMAGERELVDVFLTERRSIAEVRDAISRALPAGYRLVDLHDAWLGEPALPAQVVAADYRVVLEPNSVDPRALTLACERLLAADSIPRERSKGGRGHHLRPAAAARRRGGRRGHRTTDASHSNEIPA